MSFFILNSTCPWFYQFRNGGFPKRLALWNGGSFISVGLVSNLSYVSTNIESLIDPRKLVSSYKFFMLACFNQGKRSISGCSCFLFIYLIWLKWLSLMQKNVIFLPVIGSPTPRGLFTPMRAAPSLNPIKIVWRMGGLILDTCIGGGVHGRANCLSSMLKDFLNWWGINHGL